MSMFVALPPSFSSAPLSHVAAELPTVKMFSPVCLVENYIGKDCARYPRPVTLPATIHSSTSLDEEASEVNAPTIYKDMQESPKDFFYGGKSVYERFQGVFDAIAALEEQADSDAQEDKIDKIKKLLSESIKLDFLNFLHTQLGDDRTHLNPEILLRFSLKASTSIVPQLNQYTQANCNSILSGVGGIKRKIELHIPSKESEDPVQIISDLSATFNRQHALAQNMQLDPKIQMVAKGVFSIPLQGKARHDVEISLTSV